MHNRFSQQGLKALYKQRCRSKYKASDGQGYKQKQGLDFCLSLGHQNQDMHGFDLCAQGDQENSSHVEVCIHDKMFNNDRIQCRKFKFLQVLNFNLRKRLFLGVIIAALLIILVLNRKNPGFIDTISSGYAIDGKITLIILSTNVQQQSYKSIKSFISNHKSLFCCFIIGVRRKGRFQFDNSYMRDFDEITQKADWVYDRNSTQKQQGDNQELYTIQFIDKLIQRVHSEYYFFTTTQWHLTDSYFVSYSKSILENFPEVAQVLPNQQEKIIRGVELDRAVGFSFAAGLHRTRDYYAVVGRFGGYEQLLAKYKEDSRKELISRVSQYKISREYLKHNLLCIVVYRFKVHKNYTSAMPITSNPDSTDPYTNEQQYEWLEKKNREEQLQQFIEKETSNFVENLFKKNDGMSTKKINSGHRDNGDRIRRTNVSSYLLGIWSEISSSQNAKKVYEVETLEEFWELPFCLVLVQNGQAIMQSIRGQNYGNYHIIEANKQPTGDYKFHKETICRRCPKNSVIMFVKSPLQRSSLHYLNSIHQTYKAWVTYSVDKSALELHSFYYRVYELLELNDFNSTNRKYREAHDPQMLALGMMELSQMSAKSVERKQVSGSATSNGYFTIFENSSRLQERYPYTKIVRLSQDMPMNVSDWQINISQKKKTPYQILNQTHMKRAIDRQQQFYLPLNHSIYQIEHQQHSKAQPANKQKEKEKENHLCVTVLNHNNVEHNRYKKLLQSIIYQQYNNYHIVFVDDNSTDGSMSFARQYLKGEGFPDRMVVFVQNLRRNYATYNIINAAFNFCNEDDIQVVVDGDDEIIGREAFRVINQEYIRDPELWVVYSNYKTNFQGYGRSAPFQGKDQYMNNGKRVFVSNIGPIRTWLVKLMYVIPKEYHKMQDGSWLDTVYDDALQHSILELSSLKRVRYINQILYEYNTKYGDNDDSTTEKLVHRTLVYRHIMNLPPLKAFQSLDRAFKSQDIQKQLDKDKNFRYTVS